MQGDDRVGRLNPPLLDDVSSQSLLSGRQLLGSGQTVEPCVSQGILGTQTLRRVACQKLPDKVFRVLGDTVEDLIIEVVPTDGDVAQGDHVRFAHKRREAGEEDVADDADAPHVSEASDGIEVDDLRGDKLGRAKEDLQLLVRIVEAGHSKVNDLDLVASLGQAENVLRLQVQVDDALRVHKGNTLDDLSHEALAGFLR